MPANVEVAEYQVATVQASETTSEDADQHGDAQSIVEAAFRSMTSMQEYYSIVYYAIATGNTRQIQLDKLSVYTHFANIFPSLFEEVDTPNGGTRHQMRSDVQDYIRANARALSLCVGSDQRRMAQSTSR